MKWQRLSYLPVFMALLLQLSLMPAFGLRCKNRIVSIGNTASEVLSKCGEPTHFENSKLIKIDTGEKGRD